MGEAFQALLDTGLTPSIVAWNTLLGAYAALGAWGEALEAMGHVAAAAGEGVNPNTGKSRWRAGRGAGLPCSSGR